MATLYTEQSRNVHKTWLLMFVFLALVIVIGYFIGYYYNDPIILAIALIFAFVMNFSSFYFSDKIALSLAGAKNVSHDEYPDLYHTVENLSIAAGLPTPRIYVINDPAPNAFATGRDKEHAAVAVTSGLLEKLNKTELEGVIGHELSHIGNRDILLQSVVVVLVGFVAILAHIFTRGLSFGGGRRRGEKGGELGALLLVVGIIFIILSPVIAQLIQLAISRKREYLADACGALLTRYPEGLASALEKISAHSEPMSSANNATAHLFISNPFGAKAARGLSRLFMTHPPIEERIRILRGMRG